MRHINFGLFNIVTRREFNWHKKYKFPIGASLLHWYFMPPIIFRWRWLNVIVGVRGIEFRIFNQYIRFWNFRKVKFEFASTGCLWPPFTFVLLRKDYTDLVVGLFLRVTWFWIRITWDDI